MDDAFLTRETVHAPELSGALAWLNVDTPLSLNALRGHVVLIDFWTYCCINCMHVQPTLQELSRRFSDEPFVVVGVHSGKFSAERDPERIAEAIGRYGMRHPVAVDDDMRIWSRYAIRSWPTLVVVRADGTIAATAPGEPDLERLSAFIGAELDRAREAGALAPKRLDLAPSVPKHEGPLRYPGKVTFLPDGRVAISDSGHHRVLLCGPTGRVERASGSGRRGLLDGPPEEAAFDDPQGLCWFDDALFVADTRNHVIRRVDAVTGGVTTVAGTGELGPVHAEHARAPALDVSLRSPWDLCVVEDSIFIAMAGSHQIWRLMPRTGEIELFAGTGVEALLDGRKSGSAWAQPSGLALVGKSMSDGRLVVADSESSAIRSIVLATGEVETHMGQGLFDFGDADGDLDAAALQHPLGVAAEGDDVLIADTYNGKIKRLCFGEMPTVQTVLEGFSEPADIAVGSDGLWLVADTNAHRICGVRDNVVSTFSVRGAPRVQVGVLTRARPASVPPPQGWFDQRLDPGPNGLRPGPAELQLRLEPPEGTYLEPGSPWRVSVEVSRRSDLLTLPEGDAIDGTVGDGGMKVVIPLFVGSLTEPQIEAEMVLAVDHVVCCGGEQARCVMSRLHLRVPLRLQRDDGVEALSVAAMTNRADEP